MASENLPHHYNYSRLEDLLINHYTPQEIADKLRETRLVLAEQMAKDDFASACNIECYRMLYDLEDVFRKLSRP